MTILPSIVQSGNKTMASMSKGPSRRNSKLKNFSSNEGFSPQGWNYGSLSKGPSSRPKKRSTKRK